MGEDGKTRRLPSWMMSSIAIVVVENKEPSSVIETQEEEEEGGGKRKQARRATARPTPTKKPKTRTRRRRHHSSSSSDEDPISLALEEEEEDDQLTVDDLITIAQEYVKADDARAKQTGVTVEPNSRNTIPSTTRKEKEKLQEVRMGPDSEEPTETTSLTSRNSSSSTFGVEVSPTLASSSKLADMKDGEHLPMGETIYNSCKTGDPAQDMLDLFLGPLLNKPKIELMKHEALRKESAFGYGLEKPSQKEETGKQLPPLTKKKSSLRDQVAMFFD